MKVVILGNGIAGITCARFVRKLSGCDITVVSDESDYFFSRTALMYVYMGHMRFRDIKPYEDWFWEKNRINLVRARIERVDFQKKTLYTNKDETILYDKLLLATGSISNKFGWPGQDLGGVHGLYHYQDLEAMERHTPGLDRAVIVGGGLIGVEMAEMFHSRGIPVTFLVRESDFWNVVLPPEESRMVSRHLREHHIDLRLETELKEILPRVAPPAEGEGGVTGSFSRVDTGRATLSPPPGGPGGAVGAVVTNKGDTIPCGFVGLTVGVRPNIDFLKNSGLEINRGILVDEYLETNMPDVYAAGDCAELRSPAPGRKPIEAVWYTGRMMGETSAYNIVALSDSLTSSETITKTSYDSGIWFNSAKFFDIEYQVYGEIQPQLPENQETLYWEHPDGKKSIRLNYKKASGRIVGFNLMGVRYRHEVCDKWLRSGAHIEDVLQHLGMANFDPEFYPQYEEELIKTYNLQTGKNLKMRQKRSLKAALEFLR